ncbi:FAD-dependent oxidoreductase [PVC group bacterium]|nr:FAD-dependent oxidoreductase [PVC group bacterium]
MDKIKTDLVVLGAGPGGYAAAFYAADLGKKVILVEKESRLGGVCLNQGCIPSKALLHATHQIRAAEESSARGIEFSAPKIHLDKMRAWKEGILEKLGQGILVLSKRRNVEILSGKGYFEDSKTLRVETVEGQKFIEFEHAIIAVGSKPTLPAAFDLGNPKIMTSTEALDIEDIPGELLIVGAGYIGMELGTVYAALGSKITLVEALDTMLSGVDADLVKPVQSYAEKNFKEIRLKAKVKKMSTSGKKIRVIMEYDGKNQSEEYGIGELVMIKRDMGRLLDYLQV